MITVSHQRYHQGSMILERPWYYTRYNSCRIALVVLAIHIPRVPAGVTFRESKAEKKGRSTEGRWNSRHFRCCWHRHHQDDVLRHIHLRLDTLSIILTTRRALCYVDFVGAKIARQKSYRNC